METRKIAIGILAIGIVAALSGGMIYAYFTDSDKSENNEFTAGTLFLTLNPDMSEKTVANTGSFDNMQPGNSGIATLIVKNAGTVDGYVTFKFINLVDEEHLPADADEPLPEKELGGVDGELSRCLDVKVSVIRGSSTLSLPAQFGTDTNTVTFKSLDAIESSPRIKLESGQSLTLSIAWSISGTVGNEIQGDKLSFDISFTLNQFDNNPSATDVL